MFTTRFTFRVAQVINGCFTGAGGESLKVALKKAPNPLKGAKDKD
ncbi:MAG: hypothetical protein RIS84_1449 [Pseudomonadota bacterium]|jgi:hypothetical protein